MRCVLLSFIKFFARPIFTKTPHGERSSPSILKIKLSIDRDTRTKFRFTIFTRRSKGNLDCREPVSPIEKKRKKPRNKLLFGQNYRPFPWKPVHAVRKDGEKAIWRVKFWSGRPINFRGESRILVWPGRERRRASEQAGRQAVDDRFAQLPAVATSCNAPSLSPSPLSSALRPSSRSLPQFSSLLADGRRGR